MDLRFKGHDHTIYASDTFYTMMAAAPPLW